jgi:hypothetical protein
MTALKLAGDQDIEFQAGLVFLMRWFEDKAPLHSFATNFEQKSDKIFSGLFYHHRVTELYSYSM